jgi:uncharacterized protein YcbX
VNAPQGDAQIAALYRYPIKSARGQPLQSVTLVPTGFMHDREWMVVDQRGVFITQREQPRLALLLATLREHGDATPALGLDASGLPTLNLVPDDFRERRTVRVWRDEVQALDAGDAASRWLSDWLGITCRLVRFAPDSRRLSSMEWTQGVPAPNQFSDGYPILVLSRASIADLSQRVGSELPVNRFRPNLLLEGLQPYDEDRIHELQCGPVRLRLVKPCARCVITTTDQDRGERSGDEPLRTLRGYRHDRALQGLLFGQNAIIVEGVGARLQVGTAMQVTWRAAP